jgi:hypothetical protein
MPTNSPYQAPDDPQHDLGPWIESPNSSRCSRYRYDYATRQLQVTWTNGIGHVHTLYEGVDSEVYRRFARSASKGKFVNRILNGHGYEAAEGNPAINAPSNPNRSHVQARS